MANKYLDQTGLSYFWSKIKAALANKASIDSSNTYSGEQKFQNSLYCPVAGDNAAGVGAAYKASRGAVNQEIVGQIIMPCTDVSDSYGGSNEVNKIKFQKIIGVNAGVPTLEDIATLTEDNFDAPSLSIQGQNIDTIIDTKISDECLELAERISELEYMIAHNDFYARLAVDDKEEVILVDDLGYSILVDWKYKEV